MMQTSAYDETMLAEEDRRLANPAIAYDRLYTGNLRAPGRPFPVLDPDPSDLEIAVDLLGRPHALLVATHHVFQIGAPISLRLHLSRTWDRTTIAHVLFRREGSADIWPALALHVDEDLLLELIDVLPPDQLIYGARSESLYPG
ncbi:MAG: hypothetical protein KF901_19345 [Myxococcales bacterium]|nr:hypothetical protein [Myxococcales bacterium]